MEQNSSLTVSHRSQISFIPSATGISNLMLNFCPEMLTSGVTSQPTQLGARVQTQKKRLDTPPKALHSYVGTKRHLSVCTSKIHLVSRSPVCLLFTLVTGNCDILECAPVLLIALQCQFLGSAKYTRGRQREMRVRWVDKKPQDFFIHGQDGVKGEHE